ncbi:hypothetical protein CBS101457_003450 [Exobasidium rhododendri]|nr:hypothetical protein CBS101457_003450 [Exobasidium rhododendri]
MRSMSKFVAILLLIAYAAHGHPMDPYHGFGRGTENYETKKYDFLGSSSQGPHHDAGDQPLSYPSWSVTDLSLSDHGYHVDTSLSLQHPSHQSLPSEWNIRGQDTALDLSLRQPGESQRYYSAPSPHRDASGQRWENHPQMSFVVLPPQNDQRDAILHGVSTSSLPRYDAQSESMEARQDDISSHMLQRKPTEYTEVPVRSKRDSQLQLGRSADATVPHGTDSLLAYTGADGKSHMMSYEDVRAVLGITKSRLLNGARLQIARLKEHGVTDNSQLPSLRRRAARIPSQAMLEAMDPGERQKWMTAFAITKEQLELEARESVGAAMWREDALRSGVEVLPDGWTEEMLLPSQRAAIASHRAKFPSHEMLGKANTSARRSYMDSHLNIRHFKVPWPVPQKGRDHYSIASYIEKTNRKLLKKRIEWGKRKSAE